MPVLVEELVTDDPTDEMVKSAARVHKRLDRIASTQKEIGQRRGRNLETGHRRGRFEAREERLRAEGAVMAAELGHERTIGSDDWLDYEFLEQGMLAGQSVGQVTVEYLGLYGSGFLVGPNVMLTNNHVLPSATVARAASLRLGVETDLFPAFPSKEVDLALLPDELFITNKSLDFTLVAVDTSWLDEEPYWIPLLKEQGKIKIGHPVNVIQHPGRKAKKQLAVYNSHLLDIEDGGEDDPFCWYSADTDRGSSGSPVFNRRWEVIALHHRAVPRSNKKGEVIDVDGKTMSRERLKNEPEKVDWIANEGVRASRIVQAIETAECDPAHEQARNRILKLWSSPRARKHHPKRGWLGL